MDKIHKSEVRKILISSRKDIAAHLDISVNHTNDLINFGDKGDEHRSVERGNALTGVQFREWVAFLIREGFTKETALRLARYGVGNKNRKSKGIYFFNIDGRISDHNELQINKYQRAGR